MDLVVRITSDHFATRIFRKPLISFHDAVPELNTANIQLVLISDTREKSYYLDAEETEQLISILDNLVMKRNSYRIYPHLIRMLI